MVAKNVYEKFNIPYIVISHGHDIPFIFPKQMMKYHLVTYFWLKSIFGSAAKTVLLTKEMKAAADKFLGKNKAQNNVIIPNKIAIIISKIADDLVLVIEIKPSSIALLPPDTC